MTERKRPNIYVIHAQVERKGKTPPNTFPATKMSVPLIIIYQNLSQSEKNLPPSSYLYGFEIGQPIPVIILKTQMYVGL